MPVNPNDGPWLVWSNEHNAWWRPEWKGYTQQVRDAGRYGLAEARQICDGPPMNPRRWTAGEYHGTPDEVMVPSPEMLSALAKPQG
ncbi:MAG TPA: hypothetical protein VGN72_01190 [Tepidisphaeraceae bacterium]|nr:hypothetical protein [Tepidisphaeraceae bacterium]